MSWNLLSSTHMTCLNVATFVSNPAASHKLVMLRQLVLVISADGGWRPVSGPLSPTRLLLFTPSLTFLSGTAFPFGLPPGVSHEFPLSVDDQRETEAWQLQSHQRLEQELQEFRGELGIERIHGYVTLSLDRQKGQAPIVIQELPETVGGKVWRGAWLLWKSLETYGLQGASKILEVGAGVGLVGLLLAADYGLKVTLSETKTAYSGAVVTWENLVNNIDVNREKIMEAGGHVEALELDWSQSSTSDSSSFDMFDMVIGSDILYEPHLFQDLLNVMQEAAPKAVLVQNLARKGTDYFLDLCEKRQIQVIAVDVSHLDADEPWMAGAADAKDGVYHCWFLDFTKARSKNERNQ